MFIKSCEKFLLLFSGAISEIDFETEWADIHLFNHLSNTSIFSERPSTLVRKYFGFFYWFSMNNGALHL
jgi:hypothetical protein